MTHFGSSEREDARKLQLQSGFASLDQRLKDFITEYTQGQDSLKDLVDSKTSEALISLSCDMVAIKRLISTEGDKTRQHVTDIQN
jgi:hypothetical protein